MVNNIGIIGTGRLGLSLALALEPFCSIPWVCNRKGTSIQGFNTISIEELSNKMLHEVDCIAICTIDKEIENVVAKILQTSSNLQDKVFFHCSGAVSVSVLEPLHEVGSSILAMHPYQTLPFPDKTLLQSIPWLIEGYDEAFFTIQPMLKHLNAITYKTKNILTAEEKLLWHSTAVISSNFTATLYQIAASIINKLGIDSPEVFIQSIAQQTITNAHKSLHNNGRIEMSGPIIRGDMNIVYQEIEALASINPLFSSVYKQLSEATKQISTTILNDSPVK